MTSPTVDEDAACASCGHARRCHSSFGMCDGDGTECYCVRFPDAPDFAAPTFIHDSEFPPELCPGPECPEHHPDPLYPPVPMTSMACPNCGRAFEASTEVYCAEGCGRYTTLGALAAPTPDALDVEALAEAMASASPSRPGIHAEARAIAVEYARVRSERGQL